jgi:hypothetical protein
MRKRPAAHPTEPSAADDHRRPAAVSVGYDQAWRASLPRHHPMILPNFLIVGAAKAGTSSLYSYLEQHPQVFVSPVKEPRYFAYRHRVRSQPRVRKVLEAHGMSLEQYARLFRNANGARAIGEASTFYLYSRMAPLNIRRAIPDARLIAVLRQPVDRAYSHFSQRVRDGQEPLRDFRRAIAEEERRIADGWPPPYHYLQRGHYAAQLKRYLALFEPDQLRVYLYEDLCDDPGKLVRSIFEFLGVDPAFQPDLTARLNASSVPRFGVLDDAVRRRNALGRLLHRQLPAPLWARVAPKVAEFNRHRPALDRGLRAELTEQLRDDILELQALIGRDLSAWLGAP